MDQPNEAAPAAVAGTPGPRRPAKLGDICRFCREWLTPGETYPTDAEDRLHCGRTCIEVADEVGPIERRARVLADRGESIAPDLLFALLAEIEERTIRLDSPYFRLVSRPTEERPVGQTLRMLEERFKGGSTTINGHHGAHRGREK